MAEAPKQQDMAAGGGDLITSIFANKEALLVKQTMRGCIQECLGCEAKSEFHVSAMDFQYLEGAWLKEGASSQQNELYALEKSSFLCRCCWRDGRPFNMEVTQYNPQDEKGAGGAPVINFDKPCGFPVICVIGDGDKKVEFPCCCMLPNVTAKSPDGRVLSNSRYICDACLYVPKLMYSEDGKDIYKLRPQTCCMGCCPSCSCGKNGCRLPFYFWDPETGERIKGGDDNNEPQILKVWAGMKKECCSTADTFAVFFPRDCTPERKAGILGMTFLIDFTVFERQGE